MADNYLRAPHLIGDRLVFVADDDVWLVGADGGRADRLTSDRTPVSRPRLDADASMFAWTSRRDGNPEVYVAPVDGGPARRLTFWNHVSTRVLGWDAAGRVVATTPAHQPFRSHAWAYALPVDGGPAERLPYGPTNGLAREPGGAVVLQSVVNREPATWKRYRGGTRGRLWLDADGSGEFARLLRDVAGQLADPVWVDGRVAFVSDHQGHGNVYSVLPDGSDLRRHSDHTGNYARDLAGDLEGGSTRLVYQRAGELYRVDDLSADSRPVPLEVSLPGVRVARQPLVAPVRPALDSASALDVDMTGRASALTVRGTVRWLTHRDGPVRALAASPGVRHRLGRVRPGDEAAAVWVTDGDGDDALEWTDGTGTTRLNGDFGRVLELAVSPDGASFALTTHDCRVLAVDAASRAVRELARGTFGDAQGLAFSPDSAWLAWSEPHPGELRSIRLCELASGSITAVTEERFSDTDPCFTPDGRYLAFLSTRTFDPVYDSQNFELSFTVGTRPYLVPLAAGTASPFDPEVSGRAVAADKDESSAKDASDGAPVTVRVELDGLAERVVAVPVGAGLLTELRAARGGLLWLDNPITGEIGAGLPEGAEPLRPTLYRWDFASRRKVKLVDGLDWYAVSKDGSRIVVRDGEHLRVGPADHEVKPDDGDGGGQELVTVDLDRVQVRVDPPAEWRQMLVETWRLMRDHFWIEDMGGVDWDDVLTRYEPLVGRIATRDDLSEVLWEMIGELGSSHAYERMQYAPAPPGRAAAFLGADLESDGTDWTIARVLPAESSVPAARSPLLAAGVDVRAGDRLVAVNGVPLGVDGPGPLLAGLAGKPVELEVSREGTPRRVVVVPTADETPIRYQDWVSSRRALVHEAGGGRIGYVHIPDMVSTGWAEFNRDLRHEIEYDALLVDTRDNGGGHTSELVIERLSRRWIGGDVSRHGSDPRYPTVSPRGPMVSLANEHAGSDGDIVNEAFRELGLGPIVGVRTWGGVIGIDGRYSLVDGTSVTQPRYSFWFRDAGWGVENYGVDPDVYVPYPPQAWAAGDDPQLTEAIRVLSGALESFEVLTPTPLAQRPDRSAPALPPR